MIDKKSPIPIYHQLEEQLRQQISDGSLKPEEVIPSERELSETYEISRMTVRQALNNLVGEGILFRLKGKGTYVSPKKVEQGLLGLTSFTEDMLERGLTPNSELLSFSRLMADKQTALNLHIGEGQFVFQVDRIRTADQLPMAFESAFMPCSLMENLTEEQAQGSIYQYLQEQLSLRIEDAYQQIEAAAATDKEAKLLDIKVGDPVLRINRTSFLEDGTAFEYVKSTFRADRYRFTHHMKRI